MPFQCPIYPVHTTLGWSFSLSYLRHSLIPPRLPFHWTPFSFSYYERVLKSNHQYKKKKKNRKFVYMYFSIWDCRLFILLWIYGLCSLDTSSEYNYTSRAQLGCGNPFLSLFLTLGYQNYHSCPLTTTSVLEHPLGTPESLSCPQRH